MGHPRTPICPEGPYRRAAARLSSARSRESVLTKGFQIDITIRTNAIGLRFVPIQLMKHLTFRGEPQILTTSSLRLETRPILLR